MDKKLQISKLTKIDKAGKYAMISVKLKAETAAQIEQIARETNRSRNEVLNIMLEFVIERCEITEK